MKRCARVIAISIVVVMVGALVSMSGPGVASAASGFKIAGFAVVPGGTLNLPLPLGATPVTIQVQLGAPATQLPIQITPSTRIQSETGRPVTLADGDRVKINAVVSGGALVARKLTLQAFPELEVTGTASGLPAAGVTFPIAHGTTVPMVVTLAPGITVPVVLTENTKVEHGLQTLANGAIVRVDAVFKSGQLVVTEISVKNEDEDDDD